MCLTTEALVLFLNILTADLITTEPGRITVHATEGDVHWIAYGEQWCTDEVELDSKVQFSL